jgi:hypothetical protein
MGCGAPIAERRSGGTIRSQRARPANSGETRTATRGWRERLHLLGIGIWPSGTGGSSCNRSAPLSMSSTPGAAEAARQVDRMRACAAGLRTKAACSIRGRTRSAMNCPWRSAAGGPRAATASGGHKGVQCRLLVKPSLPPREFVGITELDQTRRIRRRKSGVGQRQILADKIIGGSGAEIKDCCGRTFYRRQIGSGIRLIRLIPDARITPCWSVSVSSPGVCRYNCATPAREQSSSC